MSPKPVHIVKVSDEGFAGAVIRLYKGDTVRWTWKNCAELHNITERKYNISFIFNCFIFKGASNFLVIAVKLTILIFNFDFL